MAIGFSFIVELKRDEKNFTRFLFLLNSGYY